MSFKSLGHLVSAILNPINTYDVIHRDNGEDCFSIRSFFKLMAQKSRLSSYNKPLRPVNSMNRLNLVNLGGHYLQIK